MLLKDPPEISWENTLGSPHGVPFDEDTKELLKKCLDASVPPPTSLAELMKRSEAFPVKFPISTMRCASLRNRGIGAETIEVCVNPALFHRGLNDIYESQIKYSLYIKTYIKNCNFFYFQLAQSFDIIIFYRKHFYSSFFVKIFL